MIFLKLSWKHINNWPCYKSRFFYFSFTTSFMFFCSQWTISSNVLKVFTCIVFLNRHNNLFFVSDCTYLLSSFNPSYILSLPFFSPSRFSLIELYLSRLNLTKFDLSKPDSNQKVLCPSQKSSSSLCFLKNLLFHWFFLSIFWCFLFSMTYMLIWAKCYLHFLLSPIVKRWLHHI